MLGLSPTRLPHLIQWGTKITISIFTAFSGIFFTSFFKEKEHNTLKIPQDTLKRDRKGTFLFFYRFYRGCAQENPKHKTQRWTTTDDGKLPLEVMDLYPQNRKLAGAATRTFAAMAKITSDPMQNFWTWVHVR